jgi:hypothetical protein
MAGEVKDTVSVVQKDGTLYTVYILYKSRVIPSRGVLKHVMDTIGKETAPENLAEWLVKEANRA